MFDCLKTHFDFIYILKLCFFCLLPQGNTVQLDHFFFGQYAPGKLCECIIYVQFMLLLLLLCCHRDDGAYHLIIWLNE